MISFISRFIQRLGKWRFVLLIFLLLYFTILLIELDYSTVHWDETPHLNGGFLFSRGQFQEYVETESFYPPAFDLVTGLFFKILGPSVFTARLVAVIFGVLSVWVVFEIANQIYGPKVGLLSSLILASMPGFVWLSRLALLESMLLFFFSLSLLLFLSWMRTNKIKMLLLAGISLGFGFLVKYQAMVAGIVMLVVLFVMGKQKIEKKFGKIFFLAIIVLLIVLPWFIFSYEQYASETLETWIHSIQVGNEDRFAYSTRFPWPIFYFIEMVWPYSYAHPVSIFVYILGLLGVGLLLKRRSNEDRFLVIAFFVIYFFFTLISSKDWRYISLIFPVLSIACSEFIIFIFDNAKKMIKKPHVSNINKNFYKIITGIFVFIVSFSLVFSIWESYLWLESEHFNFPVGEACKYISENSTENETAVAYFPTNFFNIAMMRFYLDIYDSGQQRLIEFPENAVDVYKPIPNDHRFFFSINRQIQRYEVMNVKYLLMIEWEIKYYFESFYDSSDVLGNLTNTGRFMLETEFGSYPHRMFIIRFLPDT
ncbi:glycosyltransferase family 39 protein [Candidatus Bathyarchaeota archaeon]|nr:glycosyltransferase family 39 protein [Candidatus Bathyarchaeota archaeon]